MLTMSNIHRDVIASHLRLQIDKLNAVLTRIEEDSSVDCAYANDSLKEIEMNLKKLRKICADS